LILAENFAAVDGRAGRDPDEVDLLHVARAVVKVRPIEQRSGNSQTDCQDQTLNAFHNILTFPNRHTSGR
jgi:hypothetical protein